MHSDLNVKKTNIGAREIHDRNTFTTLRVTNRHNNNDIRRLCTGWIATYHVWKLENPGCPAAKIQMPLDADDIVHPLRKYLDYPITDGLDFPLAIGPDATSFCILRTMYTVHLGKDKSDSKILSHRLNVVTPFESDFVWSAPKQDARLSRNTYNAHFSPRGQFLTLHESSHEASRIIMYKYSHSFEAGLEVGLVNKLDVSNLTDKLEHLNFHPRRTLLVFHGRVATNSFRKENLVFMWDFVDGKCILNELYHVDGN